MKKQIFAALVCTGVIWASPITLDFTGIATGTIGSNSFLEAPFEITVQSDSTTLYQLFGRSAIDSISAVVTIAGIGSATFAEQTHVQIGPVYDPSSNAIVTGYVLFAGNPFLLFGIENPLLLDWQFTSSIGPLPANYTIWNGANFLQTSAGQIHFDNASNGTFSAVVVGEPPLWTEILLGVFVLTLFNTWQRVRLDM